MEAQSPVVLYVLFFNTVAGCLGETFCLINFKFIGDIAVRMKDILNHAFILCNQRTPTIVAICFLGNTIQVVNRCCLNNPVIFRCFTSHFCN